MKCWICKKSMSETEEAERWEGKILGPADRAMNAMFSDCGVCRECAAINKSSGMRCPICGEWHGSDEAWDEFRECFEEARNE